MASFPTTPSSSSFVEATLKPAHRSETSINGYLKTRPNWTANKKQFTVGWSSLTNTQKDTFDAFFIANTGIAFTYTHPGTSAEYTCIFEDDEMRFTYVPTNRWNVEIKIREQ